MTAKLFEAALGIATPWIVASVDFDESDKTLTVLIDFQPGTDSDMPEHIWDKIVAECKKHFSTSITRNGNHIPVWLINSD